MGCESDARSRRGSVWTSSDAVVRDEDGMATQGDAVEKGEKEERRENELDYRKQKSFFRLERYLTSCLVLSPYAILSSFLPLALFPVANCLASLQP